MKKGLCAVRARTWVSLRDRACARAPVLARLLTADEGRIKGSPDALQQEDQCQSMAAHRRRDALQRVLFMFEREFERERKGREGLEYLNEVYDRSPQTVPSNDNERSAVMVKIRSVCLRLVA